MSSVGWIELSGNPAEHEARVRELVHELGADWEVRSAHGVGIDPVSMLVVISVPFSIFFTKFLERAADDSYTLLKSWLKRIKGGVGRADIELRDPMRTDRIVILAYAPDETYGQLLPHLTRAMVALGDRLDSPGNATPSGESEQWYRRAARAGDPQAMCRLVELLGRQGDPARANEARYWYRRAIETLPVSDVERLLAALRDRTIRRRQEADRPAGTDQAAPDPRAAGDHFET